ncbi:MAG: hypothetical protein ACKVQW_12685 [Pyrinomonadaceae bacterium]
MKSSDRMKLMVVAVVALVLGSFCVRTSDWLASADAATTTESATELTDDKKKARAAFTEAFKVFSSARCLNCHPKGDTPLQGNEGREHDFVVTRGADGRGEEPMLCASCHLDKNQDEEGLPPGTTNWHMPSAAQKMVFQGLTAAELCRNLKDPLKNGGKKSAKAAVEHISKDPLVLWAWSPGRGRTPPPMSHQDFVKKMNAWVANGAACPE